MMQTEDKYILLIEDDGAMANSIQEAIKKKNNFVIVKAFSYISAIGKWMEAGKIGREFEYIILDLNISVAGMPGKLLKEYYPYSGLAFFFQICDNNPDLRKKYEKITFMYTGYEIPLKSKALEKGWDLSGLKILSKRPDSIDELIQMMNF